MSDRFYAVHPLKPYTTRFLAATYTKSSGLDRTLLLEPFLHAIPGLTNPEEIIREVATDILIHGKVPIGNEAEVYARWAEECHCPMTLEEFKRIARHQDQYGNTFPRRGFTVTRKWLTFRFNLIGDMIFDIANSKPAEQPRLDDGTNYISSRLFSADLLGRPYAGYFSSLAR